MKKTRIGQFIFDRKDVFEMPERCVETLKLLDFLPLTVELMPHKDCFHYVGISPLFDEVEGNTITPFYEVHVDGVEVTLKRVS